MDHAVAGNHKVEIPLFALPHNNAIPPLFAPMTVAVSDGFITQKARKPPKLWVNFAKILR